MKTLKRSVENVLFVAAAGLLGATQADAAVSCHKINAKGFLIRSGTDVKINVTWAEVLAADCGR